MEKEEGAKEWDFTIIKDHTLCKLEARKSGYEGCISCF